MFRVDTATDRFVLRVGDETRIHVDGVEDVEAHWLLHLDRTEITAPQPVPSAEGKFRVDHETDYVSGVRACSMFSFIEGRELRKAKVDAAAIMKAGQLLALLHEDASTALPTTPVPSELRADRVVYFHRVDLLQTYQSEFGSLFREAIERVQEAITSLWTTPPHDPHLLHGDFGAHNVMIWRNELRPIDFQDLQLGFDIQDVGITLADLSRTAPELCASFLEGYRSIRELPEISPGLLATFAAGRNLNIMNLGLHLQRKGIEQFLESNSRLVQQWMRTD